MFKLGRLTLILGLMLSAVHVGYSQDSLAHIDLKVTCVCFEKDSDFIAISTEDDSTLTRFSIIREGYESEKKREKILKRQQNKNLNIEPPIPFSHTYYSTSKPKRISSIESISKCVEVIPLERYRSDQYTPPENTRSNLVIFIQHIQDGVYLKWNAIRMDIE